MIAYIVWELNTKYRGLEGQQRFVPHSLWADVIHTDEHKALGNEL